jgi:hypothetical protein
LISKGYSLKSCYKACYKKAGMAGLETRPIQSRPVCRARHRAGGFYAADALAAKGLAPNLPRAELLKALAEVLLSPKSDPNGKVTEDVIRWTLAEIGGITPARVGLSDHGVYFVDENEEPDFVEMTPGDEASIRGEAA